MPVESLVVPQDHFRRAGIVGFGRIHSAVHVLWLRLALWTAS